MLSQLFVTQWCCALCYCRRTFRAFTTIMLIQSTISYLQTTPKRQNLTPPNDWQSHTRELQSCTDDVKARICHNQLKLNEDKTEGILFSTPSLSSCHCLPWSVHTKWCYKTKSGTYGLFVYSNLTMKQHTIKICHTASCELKRISSFRRYSQKMQQNNW